MSVTGREELLAPRVAAAQASFLEKGGTWFPFLGATGGRGALQAVSVRQTPAP